METTTPGRTSWSQKFKGGVCPATRPERGWGHILQEKKQEEKQRMMKMCKKNASGSAEWAWWGRAGVVTTWKALGRVGADVGWRSARRCTSHWWASALWGPVSCSSGSPKCQGVTITISATLVLLCYYLLLNGVRKFILLFFFNLNLSEH